MGVLAMIAKAVAGTSAGALFLGYLGIIKPLQYYGRYTVYVLLVIVGALYGVSASIVCIIIGKRGLAQWATGRFFAVIVNLFLGIKFDVVNPEVLNSTRPGIFITNHQSMLDVCMLGATFPRWCSVTSKKALKYYPFLGWFMWASGTVFIDRGDRKTAINAFNKAKLDMEKTKQSVFMFPEGTRSHAFDLSLLPFKKGAFHFAIQAQVPIVPYVTQNYTRVWSHPRKCIKTGTIKVKVLDPIPTTGMTSADAGKLAELVEKKMLEAYNDLGFSQPTSN